MLFIESHRQYFLDFVDSMMINISKAVFRTRFEEYSLQSLWLEGT